MTFKRINENSKELGEAAGPESPRQAPAVLCVLSHCGQSSKKLLPESAFPWLSWVDDGRIGSKDITIRQSPLF